MILTRRDSRDARLYSLAVRPSRQRRGIGAALLDAAEAEARARGKIGLRLEVRADNIPAIELYGARGYTRCGIRRAFYEDGADAIRMRRTLVDGGS